MGSATVELIVACALAGIAAVTVAGGTTLAARIAGLAETRSGAVIAATHILDSLVSIARPDAGSAQRGRYGLGWTVNARSDELHEIRLIVEWVHAGRHDSLRFDVLAGPAPRRVR